MYQLLFEDENFRILKGNRDYVVVRKNYPYEFHSHFRKYEGAKELIELFYKKVKPYGNYFSVAMQRITTEEEFESFVSKKKKVKYRNNKGRKK